MIRKLVWTLAPWALIGACERQQENAGVAKMPGNSVYAGRAAVASNVEESVTDTGSISEEDDDGTEGLFRREWDPGRTDQAHARTRFLARAYPGPNSGMLLILDTVWTSPHAANASPRYGHLDTLAVPRLLPREVFTYYCHPAHEMSFGQIGGIGISKEREEWVHPRAAWRFDTVAKRISGISPDSVVCSFTDPD
jgi:hypothetical protein